MFAQAEAGTRTGGKAMDRAAQAEAKYREALEDALRTSREHGNSSPQAAAAWDVVDEIEVRERTGTGCVRRGG